MQLCRDCDAAGETTHITYCQDRVLHQARACTHFLGPSKSASGCTLAHWKQNLNHWLPGYCMASACSKQDTGQQARQKHCVMLHVVLRTARYVLGMCHTLFHGCVRAASHSLAVAMARKSLRHAVMCAVGLMMQTQCVRRGGGGGDAVHSLDGWLPARACCRCVCAGSTPCLWSGWQYSRAPAVLKMQGEENPGSDTWTQHRVCALFEMQWTECRMDNAAPEQPGCA
jgi:hypothetical protein